MPNLQTYSGKFYNLLDPRPEDIDVLDIAHHLSQLPRFGGATERPYSVAQHCLLTSYLVAPEHALHALLHDAPEAYVGDRPTPTKWAYEAMNSGGRGYDVHDQLHDRAERTIYRALALVMPDRVALAAVKQADVLALRHEATQHLRGGPGCLPGEPGPWCAPLTIEPERLNLPDEAPAGRALELLTTTMPAGRARLMYLCRLAELGTGLGRAFSRAVATAIVDVAIPRAPIHHPTPA